MGLFSWLKGGKKEDGAAQAAAEKPPARPPSAELRAQAAELDLIAVERELKSSNGAERVDAARDLLERWRNGDAQAATALVERLDALFEDDEPSVRQVALTGVRLMRKPENLEKYASAVLACLADPAAPVRTSAVWAAVRLPGEVARAQVRAVLTGTDEPLRFDAATALAEQADSAALPVLTAALHDGYRRQEALTALMSLGDAACLPELGKLWDADDEEQERMGDFDRTALAAALARFGDARGKEHLAERAGEAGDDRPVAVEWCGRLGVRVAIPALEGLAGEEGEPARGAALRALGRLKADGAEARLLAVALDVELSDDLRMDAAEGLAEIGSELALGALRDLSVGDDEVAGLCRELLGELAAAAAQRAAAEAAQATQTNPPETQATQAPAEAKRAD